MIYINTLKHTMPSQPVPNDKPDAIKSVEETDNGSWISAILEPIDSMIRWWTINKNCINTDPAVVTKCGRIILQLKNYRNEVYDKSVAFRRSTVSVTESYKCGPESGEFKNAKRQAYDAQRELDRTFGSAGHYFQALVTKWLYENDCFKITDVEVQGDGYDFDVEIEDMYDNRYCTEVWQGKSKYHHAMNESTSIIGVHGGTIYSDPGSVPNHLSDVASSLGGISLDSRHDIPKICRKLNQLPDDRVGFLVACTQGGNLPVLWGPDFPIMPPEIIHPNKCIIVLIFDGNTASEERGTAFMVHHPDFKHIEVARKITQSLKFKRNQDIYDNKILFTSNTT